MTGSRHNRLNFWHTALMVDFIPDLEAQWDDSIEPYEITPGFAVMREATFKFPEQGVGWIEFRVVFDPVLGRLVIDRFAVSATSDVEEITGANLRAARMKLYLETAGEAMLLLRASVDDPWESADDSDQASLIDFDRESVMDRVTLAAQLYGYARLLNKPPLKYTAEELGVSQSTATRLVSHARSIGIMGALGS